MNKLTKEEEAIKNIKEHCYFANLNPKAKKALDFAVKTLEQQPCEDAISRQAVLNEINRVGVKGFETYIPNNETNGDIFQKIYDVWDYKKGEYTIDVFMKNCIARFSLDWWNAPYKKGENK